MKHLSPGDLCEIIDGPFVPPQCRSAIGLTVILVDINPRLSESEHAPMWYCAGIPSDWSVSHKLLRKLPPAPMEETDAREEELVSPLVRWVDAWGS